MGSAQSPVRSSCFRRRRRGRYATGQSMASGDRRRAVFGGIATGGSMYTDHVLRVLRPSRAGKEPFLLELNGREMRRLSGVRKPRGGDGSLTALLSPPAALKPSLEGAGWAETIQPTEAVQVRSCGQGPPALTVWRSCGFLLLVSFRRLEKTAGDAWPVGLDAARALLLEGHSVDRPESGRPSSDGRPAVALRAARLIGEEEASSRSGSSHALMSRELPQAIHKLASELARTADDRGLRVLLKKRLSELFPRRSVSIRAMPRLRWAGGKSEGYSTPANEVMLSGGDRPPLLVKVGAVPADCSKWDADLLRLVAALVDLWRGERPRPGKRSPVRSFGEGLRLPSGALLVGSHPRMQTIFESIRRVAPRPVTVLINGETGTGKELVARALHEFSDRADGPFVAVNTAALPAGLIENELFGHQPGSFTGASTSRPGLVESASGGTLFLDEVSSMPLELQSRLLRVLEERSIRRLGESRERAVNIRVVAASNQPLRRLVAQGRFREDLFHRLHVVQIDLPALRERRSDIPILAEHFLEQLRRQVGERKRLSAEASRCLSGYSFPGNIRELLNLVESAYHLSEDEWILPVHLRDRLDPARPPEQRAESLTDELFGRLCQGRADFWKDVRDPFLARDLCRRHVRGIVERGLEEAGGHYRRLLELFNLPDSDYHRLLAFLANHRCKVDFRRYR